MSPPFPETRFSYSESTGSNDDLSPWGLPPEHEDIGLKRYSIRECKHDLGIREFFETPDSGVKSWGSGELHASASDEIRDRVDLEEHVGEAVADVWINVEEWEYRIEWLVDDVQEEPDGLVDTITSTVRGLVR